jgi:hypothetical protein
VPERIVELTDVLLAQDILGLLYDQISGVQKFGITDEVDFG